MTSSCVSLPFVGTGLGYCPARRNDNIPSRRWGAILLQNIVSKRNILIYQSIGKISKEVHAGPGLPLEEEQSMQLSEEELITATIETPLGLLLAENTKDGYVYIESIEEDSHAEKSGIFRPGDILVECSAIAMKAQEHVSKKAMYNRDSRGRKGGCCSTGCKDCPFNVSNWQKVMFDCRDKSFDVVIAALSSNNARWARGRAAATITLTVARS